ncbi:MAG: hypothetical protein PHV74_03245 [Dehalococcoidia bacterium]|nr:hypothetical protein [Dehalococcoidia bacterium]
MENAIVAIFAIGLILFAMLVLSQVSLSSTDTIATAWQQRADTSADISKTRISSLGVETQNGGSIINVTLKNEGTTKIADFDHWDVILQYDHSSSEIIEILADNFETGTLDNWTQDAYNDWDVSTERFSEGSYAAHVDDADADSILTLKDAIDFSQTSGWVPYTLSFSWFIENGLDAGEYLALDIWNGTAWDPIDQLDGDATPSEENQWFDEVIDITPYTVSDFRIRFRGRMTGQNEDAFVDSVSITATPDPSTGHIERLTYAESSPGNYEWTSRGIYLNAGASEPEMLEPGILNPGEEMIIQLQVIPAIGANTTNQVIISAPNGVSTSAIFAGPAS